MKTATIHELKEELGNLNKTDVAAICLRLVKYKKENKELLSYLLFGASNLQAYMDSVKAEIDNLFLEVNSSNLYLAKKTLRKILRITNTHICYTGSKQAEVELLIYFCKSLKQSGIPIHKSTALTNLYEAQLKKVHKTLLQVHEDLQHDYLQELKGVV